MAHRASEHSLSRSGPTPPVSDDGRNYAVLFHKPHTAHTFPSTKTIHTAAKLAEAQDYVEAMAHVLRKHYDADMDEDHNTGRTLIVGKGSRTVVGELWIETLEPEFLDTVARLKDVKVRKPRLEVKRATWLEKEKLWEVLVEEVLTKAIGTFTLDSFASEGSKPWEREGAWEEVGAAVVNSNERTDAAEEHGLARQRSYNGMRRDMTLGAIYAQRSWKSQAYPSRKVHEERRRENRSDTTRT